MPKTNSFQRVSVGKETTDATQVVGAYFDTSFWGTESSVFSIWVHVVARQTNGVSEGGDYYRSATFKRDAGTLAQIGSTRVIGTDNESVGGWDVTIDMGSATVVGTTTGDNIRVLVTGASGDTVQWLISAAIIVNDESPILDAGNGVTFP